MDTDTEQLWEPGKLMGRIKSATKSALKSGALLPIATETSWFEDSGVDFQVRIVSSLTRKAEDKKRKEILSPSGKKKANPFLPYEEEMFVCDVSPTHLCLLNKFNVIDDHLLIVTRHFEDQEMLLTLSDFEATLRCMAEFDGLAFYNGGVVAGASQPHKHIQMIPLPMGDSGPKVPIEPLIKDAEPDAGQLMTSPGLPFVHSIAFLEPSLMKIPATAAKITHQIYRLMLERTGLNWLSRFSEEKQIGPYNLLITSEWMMLVKRSEEFFDSISVNAIGYAGGLLARNKKEMKLIKESGPMNILKHTAAAG